jgi:hypothetical protein
VCQDNQDVSDVDDSTHGLDYFRVVVYIPFWDTILEQLRFRFNEKTMFAGLFDTLPTNCAKYGAVEEEFMQLYGNYSQFLHANNIYYVMPHDTSGMNALVQCPLWVAKWKREFSSSTDSSTDHIAFAIPMFFQAFTPFQLLPASCRYQQQPLSAVFVSTSSQDIFA